MVDVDPMTQAIFDRLAGDATLDALLARTVIGDGTGPAVYSSDPVPPNAVLPYVVIGANVGAGYVGHSVRESMRDVIRDVSAYADRPDDGGGSVALVNAIADRVRELFHQQVLALPGSGEWARNPRLVASGPIPNDGQHAFGRVVSLHALVLSGVA